MRFLHAAGFACLLALGVSPIAVAAQEPGDAVRWAYEASDIPVDPVYRFGTLDNGLRYVIAQNDRPEGTALVRLWIDSGSLAERDNQRGLAHFLEHMAFNGSAKVPEGEMVKLLEREGLRFGADNNASTGLETTLYKLDLPRNDPALLDTALMLMRETASELTIDPEAVDRERGVILSERRVRRTYAFKNAEDAIEFFTPDARYGERLPVGLPEIIEGGTAQDIRDYYEREYVPGNAAILVVGDFDPDAVEAAIRRHFASWKAGPLPEEFGGGPIDPSRAGLTDIYLDEALSEQVTISRLRAASKMPDTAAERRQNLLRTIGYAIVNRRLEALARGEDAPFKSAGYGTGDFFDIAKSTNLVIDSADGEWQGGLETAVTVLRQALTYGFGEAEVAEQVAKIRSSQINAAEAQDTRSNAALLGAALAMLEDGQIPSTPASSLARLEAFAPYITPAAVLAALKSDAAALDNPLIRFEGRKAPEGGEQGLRAAFDAAWSAPVAKPVLRDSVDFGYSDFGTPGAVVSDTTDERFGLRLLRFDNGVMLTLKKTDIEKDRIRYRLSLDGGTLLNTREDPLATAMVATLPIGGLGLHSQDELETILAGRTVQFSLSAATDAFVMGGTTTPRDLDLQLDLLAAAITDPGYRPEGEQRYAKSVAEFFANLDGTPGRALSVKQGGLLSDFDPRFTLQDAKAYEALSFERLRAVISDRLASGAIELALVGDFDEQRAIDLVARTLGALPDRETEFQPRDEARVRSFTGNRTRHVITHSGEPDQALVQLVWPTTDDSDLTTAAQLRMLDRAVEIVVQEELRENLGKTYSPSVGASSSSEYPDYGLFYVTAEVDMGDIDETVAAIEKAITKLAEEPIDPDLIDRARRPLLEAFDNRLKSLASWMAVADRAQTEPERLERFDAWPGAVSAVTAAQVSAAARKWLVDSRPVEIVVVPAGSPLAR